MNGESTVLVVILFVLLGGCATTDEPAEPPTPSRPQTISQDIFEFIQCSHCDRDFERVALPNNYELPDDDIAVCMAYVFDKEPSSRDLLVSALMECVEVSSAEN